MRLAILMYRDWVFKVGLNFTFKNVSISLGRISVGRIEWVGVRCFVVASVFEVCRAVGRDLPV